ncbi:MAG TPA: acetyl-CoA carboxylase biotin carboxylase subunit [Acidimicrobiia bacterium]|nr:acetyl-CoA carboxylase biotin carboxylase subunit [Acidimicrobiia bacterium]
MKRLLIANRGEIALRVLRAAQDLGIETVAVFSEADAGAAHVRLADKCVPIGKSPVGKSYLRSDAIVEAAVEAGADAVHPGYGLLSERADFARAVEAAGLTFVGPDADAIDKMGDKVAARVAADKAGVPTVPGSDGAVGSVDEAASIADSIGYPVMIKAAGGGGGRGIRVVRDEAALRKEFPMASGEAGKAFGDPRMYLERFVERARHVEVQVLGDGNDVVHFFERECSLQRRRQKVVEEALSPGISSETRAAMTTAAVDLAKAVGYRSAGTVEFLVDDQTDEVFFMEMNTRIQVEHPITEWICGVDLVAEQLRIASGVGLRLAQDEIDPRGTAIEFRLTAEDPGNDFFPCPGPVEQVNMPSGPWVRVDTWLEGGGEVTPFYDSLLAKVIVWGADRAEAIARSRRALGEIVVEGVKTTVPLLSAILAEEWFTTADFHTGTLEQWLETKPLAGGDQP